MSKAEEAALKAYPEELTTAYGPLPGASAPCIFDGNRPYRIGFKRGYEAAEKETTERAIDWLKENANKYIVDLTPTYPDAPANIIVGGMCWEHLQQELEAKK